MILLQNSDQYRNGQDFSRKEHCRFALHFVQDIDYKITFTKNLGEEKLGTEVAVASHKTVNLRKVTVAKAKKLYY